MLVAGQHWSGDAGGRTALEWWRLKDTGWRTTLLERWRLEVADERLEDDQWSGGGWKLEWW